MRQQVPFSELTTLGVGGPARLLADVDGTDSLVSAIGDARREGLDLFVLGGGSNLLVADAGYDGLVVRQRARRVEAEVVEGAVRVRAEAGSSWDGLVAWTVEQGYAGLECLSGIPGDVGAAPVQNIGAYGQEVGQTIEAVHAVDRTTMAECRFEEAECGFGYRTSRFKEAWLDRYVVTAVDFRLLPGGPPVLAYPELRTRLAGCDDSPPSLAEVREAVLAIRAAKSMLLDPADPNGRSAGSFFVNPVVSEPTFQRLLQTLRGSGVDPQSLPRFRQPSGRVKLSAAWLMDHCGFGKGYGSGAAGLSTRHCLAIVNRGDASAADVVALAGEVRRGVHARSGVLLWPEPRFLGFERPVEELLR